MGVLPLPPGDVQSMEPVPFSIYGPELLAISQVLHPVKVIGVYISAKWASDQ